MHTPDDIQSLIPHKGSMCLLERIVGWNERTMTLVTSTHSSPANPLRTQGRLRAIHLCEYGAQAMAVHGGLFARARGETPVQGLLVSLRDIVLTSATIEALDGELTIEVERLQGGTLGIQYTFRVSHRDAELVRGRGAIIETPAGSRVVD